MNLDIFLHKNIVIKQEKSLIKLTKSQKATLKAIGLGKIGQSVQIIKSNNSVIGMLNKIHHLISVNEINK